MPSHEIVVYGLKQKIEKNNYAKLLRSVSVVLFSGFFVVYRETRTSTQTEVIGNNARVRSFKAAHKGSHLALFTQLFDNPEV